MLINVINRAVVSQIQEPKDNLTPTLTDKKTTFHGVPLLLVSRDY